MHESRELRLQKEVAYHEQHTYEAIQPHALNRWPFFSEVRMQCAYQIARYHLRRRVSAIIPYAERVLVAPCGYGEEVAMFNYAWPKASFIGIDISPEAVRRCAIREAILGDVANMPFPDSSFDVVMSALFFHHVVDEGFDRYLREIARVLNPGGHLVTMEFSSRYPLTWLAKPLRKIFGNITGQVEHEHAFSPSLLRESALRCGFEDVRIFPCSYGHNRLPLPITSVINPMLSLIAPGMPWVFGMTAKKI